MARPGVTVRTGCYPQLRVTTRVSPGLPRATGVLDPGVRPGVAALRVSPLRSLLPRASEPARGAGTVVVFPVRP